ncbi:hypothetical protein J4E89_000787 [Alternaria sp. Ai002NY15]|nr:hypothetical protein J4E89_000787 [Alternaria sp. Ai002NY15]
MLAGILDDFHEAYVSYVKGETLWRITKQWHGNNQNPVLKEALDDLHEGLEEIREALVNDEERPEDIPVPDVETDVLRTLEYNYYAIVEEEEHEIEEAERRTWSEDEMSDEDMGGEEEVSDKDTKVDVEQKLDDKEESEAQKAGEEETALQGQKPKGEMVCLKGIAVEEVVLTSRRRYHTVRDTYADPLWAKTKTSCQRSPGGHMLDRTIRFKSTVAQNRIDQTIQHLCRRLAYRFLHTTSLRSLCRVKKMRVCQE